MQRANVYTVRSNSIILTSYKQLSHLVNEDVREFFAPVDAFDKLMLLLALQGLHDLYKSRSV